MQLGPWILFACMIYLDALLFQLFQINQITLVLLKNQGYNRQAYSGGVLYKLQIARYEMAQI